MFKEPVEGGHPSEIITAFVGAALSLAIAFGVTLTEIQVVAILGFVASLPGVVTLIQTARQNKAFGRAVRDESKS